MIRVLSPGKDPKDALYEGNCKNCGCIISYSVSDTKNYADPRDPSDSYICVKCPTCGCGIHHEPKNLLSQDQYNQGKPIPSDIDSHVPIWTGREWR